MSDSRGAYRRPLRCSLEDAASARSCAPPVRIHVQADIDDGHAPPGVSVTEATRVRKREQKNRELKHTNEMLKRAASFFGAELDRQHEKPPTQGEVVFIDANSQPAGLAPPGPGQARPHRPRPEPAVGRRLTDVPWFAGAADARFIDVSSHLIAGSRVARHMCTEMVPDGIEMARWSRGTEPGPARGVTPTFPRHPVPSGPKGLSQSNATV